MILAIMKEEAVDEMMIKCGLIDQLKVEIIIEDKETNRKPHLS